MSENYEYYDKLKNRSNNDVLRQVFYGVKKETIVKQQQKQEGSEILPSPSVQEEATYNRFEWQVEVVRGLSPYAKVTSKALGHPVELHVYKECSEYGLRPHLDLCFPAQHDVQLSLDMLNDLVQVVKATRDILNGKETTFFNH